MEQRTLPIEVPGASLDTPTSDLSGTDRHEGSSQHDVEHHTETEAVVAHGAELSRLAQQTQKRTDRTMWIIPAFYCMMTALILLWKSWIGAERSNALLGSPLTYVPLALFWLGITGIMLRSAVRPRKQMREMTRTLVESGDVHAVGALIDAFKQEDRKTQEIAIEGLIALLPRLHASHADLLTAEHRTLLCHQLQLPLLNVVGSNSASTQDAYQRKVEFRIAILKVFAQIGEGSVLSTVEKLAQGAPRAEAQKRIQAEAQACLPPLALRIEQQRSNQTLLRASSVSATGAETLLRPAQGSNTTDPDQLLRPDAARSNASSDI